MQLPLMNSRQTSSSSQDESRTTPLAGGEVEAEAEERAEDVIEESDWLEGEGCDTSEDGTASFIPADTRRCLSRRTVWKYF